MQFITNGPDIPDELLQAHEEGSVVFFCGAGISYPAGLPGFKSLVEKIYQQLETERYSNEESSFCKGQYDMTLDLLERRTPGQRSSMRTTLKKILQPKLRRKGALNTHRALLQLAHNHDGLRLVTTNFDRIFEYIKKKDKQSFKSFVAPMLPIPKISRWDGLVYLHGLLPEQEKDTAELNQLVLTSGDFGLAYLTERWASRFVSEVFRNYVVLFVGYSIDDPVLRYMMDALSADRMMGEDTPRAYALGDCMPGEDKEKINEWRSKGAIPILYDSSNAHSALHETLHAWSENYRDGSLSKERIVMEYASTKPSNSTQQDNFIGRMLWALSDINTPKNSCV
ncbi:hypothetical protein AGMMS49957_01570 [Synergistales bacterium]|nr:hypothetical protein AGMMS49957_01570 [Synergistales bacterium]